MTKILILILSLICVASSQIDTMLIFVNGYYATETKDSTLYQIDLSDSIVKIDQYCNSVDDIAIYSGATQHKKFGIYRAGSTCLLWWYAPKTIGNYKIFKFVLGDGVDALGQLLLTRSYVYFPFDTIRSGVLDSAISIASTSIKGAVTSGAKIINGTFANAISLDSSSSRVLPGTINALQGTDTLLIDMVVTLKDLSSSHYLFSRGVNLNDRTHLYVSATGTLYFSIDSSSVNSTSTFDLNGIVSPGVPFHLALFYNGKGTTNATKLSLYINGIKRVWANQTNTIPTGLSTVSNAASIGNSAVNNGQTIDEFNLSISTGYDPDRYSMLLDSNYYIVDKIVNIDEISIRNGFYVSGIFLKSIDSVKLDNSLCSIVGQDSGYVEFMPGTTINEIVGSSRNHTIVFYYGSNSCSTVFDLSFNIGTIDSLIPASTFLKGSFVIASGKTATLNGTAATVSSQTDSTAVVVGRLRNGLQDTISLFAGSVSDSVKINYKYKSEKLTWKTK